MEVVTELWQAMAVSGKAVVVLLVILSIYSYGVMIDRGIALRWVRRRSAEFAAQTEDRLSELSMGEVLEMATTPERRKFASLASVAVASFAGGANMGVAMGAQQAMSQTVNAISVNWGPQAEANQEALNQKSEQIVQATFDEAIESLRGNYEAAREAHRQALEVIQKHCELASQNISAITKG